MRFFNYETLFLAARGDPTKIVKYFCEGKTSGRNWMINPNAIVEAGFLSEQVKAEYIGLCSLRNYEEYVHNNIVDLPLDRLPPWIPIEVVKTNPLIQLTDSKIIFLKEK